MNKVFHFKGLHSPYTRGHDLTSEIDQFQSTEFFFTYGARPVPAYMVYLNVESNPELREKVSQYIIEQDISSQPSDMSDDKLIESVMSKYEDRYSMMSRLMQKELDIKKADLALKEKELQDNGVK